jgi:hypothetical protein
MVEILSFTFWQAFVLIISAKRVGAKAASQRLIPTGERSGLQTHTRDDGKRFLVRADENLTAFVELESATRAVTS